MIIHARVYKIKNKWWARVSESLTGESLQEEFGSRASAIIGAQSLAEDLQDYIGTDPSGNIKWSIEL